MLSFSVKVIWTKNVRYAPADLNVFWNTLPDALYNDSSRTLHMPTSFEPLARCDTIYVRDCYVQLVEMALCMTPDGSSSGEPQASVTDAVGAFRASGSLTDSPAHICSIVRPTGALGTSQPFYQMLVTGTPGSGKTFWQLYLLWHLALRGETVVLDWNESSHRFLLTR